MTIGQRIEAWEKVGQYLRAIDQGEFEELVLKTRNENPWFTAGSVNLALEGIQRYLNGEKLSKWTSAYHVEPEKIRTVGVVMAGNIPLAGFHDLLVVLISGHDLQAKLSSKDSVLPAFLLNKLIAVEPRFEPKIRIAEQLRNFDAIIATGSDNSSRYFQYYFGKYPHIIRKNRTSCAVLDGSETDEELRLLGKDVFTYFGLGCRNVSKIFIPENFDPLRVVSAWGDVYVDIIHHHKYHNNYDYQKSILLVNKIPFYDSGFVILQENEKLVSPISVVYLERSRHPGDLQARLKGLADKVQCVVGKGDRYVPFGEAQQPEVWDYADGVDTMKFLEEIG